MLVLRFGLRARQRDVGAESRLAVPPGTLRLALVSTDTDYEVSAEERYRTEWEGLRLVVQQYPDHWQFFVYDVENCEVIQTASRMDADGAKRAALEGAVIHLYGPKHDLNLSLLMQMLLWEAEKSV